MCVMQKYWDRVRQLAHRGITQEQIAARLGYDPTLLSRILRGLRPAPDGFADRLETTLDQLEAAEAAADAARERVLAGTRE